jgi:hypothetical protein
MACAAKMIIPSGECFGNGDYFILTDNTVTKHASQDKMYWKQRSHSVYDVIVITQGDDHGKRTAT